MFTKIVIGKLTPGGVIGVTSKIGFKGQFKQWNPDFVEIGPNQLCRGVTKNQLNYLLKINQFTQVSKTKVYEDVEHSDISRQVISA